MTDNLGETIDNYKNQLGKYHQILSTEGKWDRSELFSEAVMNEHKAKFISAKKSKDYRTVVEVLLSLRVNALQISPELRKNLVYELIRNDIFMLQSKYKNNFVLDLLDIEKKSLRHALLALISVIVSTLKGAEYVTSIDESIVEKVMEILEKEEDGSVNQRFWIAILQKVSIKEDTIPFLVKKGIITWVVKLIGRSLDKEIHVFSLDFASALLANILHAKSSTDHLSKDKKYVTKLLETVLKIIKDKVPTSVLMHLLICLSYLSKESFSECWEAVGFFDKISEFVEWYSKIPTTDSENGEIDKRTVLDLWAHMFHPKDISNDMSQSMEYNDMKPEDKIREFENEQGDLIFEWFQDEEKMFE